MTAILKNMRQKPDVGYNYSPTSSAVAVVAAAATTSTTIVEQISQYYTCIDSRTHLHARAHTLRTVDAALILLRSCFSPPVLPPTQEEITPKRKERRNKKDVSVDSVEK